MSFSIDKIRQGHAADRLPRIARDLDDLEPWRDLLQNWKSDTDKALETLEAAPSSKDRRGGWTRESYHQRQQLLALRDDIVHGYSPTSSSPLLELAESAGVKRRKGWEGGTILNGRLGLTATERRIEELHHDRARHRAVLDTRDAPTQDGQTE